MTGPDLIPGATYHVGAACGVPHGFRPIRLRLIRQLPHKGWAGMERLEGYELDPHGYAVERRDIYVIHAGLQLLAMPANGPAHRRPINAGPLRVPRPRTSAENLPGRTR